MKTFMFIFRWSGSSWQFVIEAPDIEEAKKQAEQKVIDSGREVETAKINYWEVE